MESMELFEGISSGNLNRMLSCFHARKSSFSRGQTIHTYSSSLEKVGILLSGKAHLYCIDPSGSYTLLERFEKNGLFGELFTLPLDNLEYIVEADSDCEVLFLPYSCIVRPCANICDHHTRLIDNLFHLTTQKSQTLSFRINLLSAKTTRQKLLNYFHYIQARSESSSFTIDMSLTDLASYLGVDRSSMMRELKAMKNEGILESKGRRITMKTIQHS